MQISFRGDPPKNRNCERRLSLNNGIAFTKISVRSFVRPYILLTSNLIVLILLLIVFFQPPALAQSTHNDLNMRDFRARNLNGKYVQLQKLLEKGPVLINFWALWCVPCMKELPHIQKIGKKYKEKGLTIIAINEDSPSDQSKVKPFIRQKRYAFEIVIDKNKDIWNKFLILSLPTTLLLNQKGEIVYSHAGYKPGDEVLLVAEIEKLFERENKK